MKGRNHRPECQCCICQLDIEARHYPTLEQSFWRLVEKGEGCWLWLGVKDTGGYGMLNKRREPGKKLKAHRVSWEIHYGPIPDGMFVCHHCDNPPCVNPAHLFVGSVLDNTRDMVAKGRHRPALRKTHCIRGHEYTPENTAINKARKFRFCRECANAPRRKGGPLFKSPAPPIEIRPSRPLSLRIVS